MSRGFVTFVSQKVSYKPSTCLATCFCLFQEWDADENKLPTRYWVEAKLVGWQKPLLIWNQEGLFYLECEKVYAYYDVGHSFTSQNHNLELDIQVHLDYVTLTSGIPSGFGKGRLAHKHPKSSETAKTLWSDDHFPLMFLRLAVASNVYWLCHKRTSWQGFSKEGQGSPRGTIVS